MTIVGNGYEKLAVERVLRPGALHAPPALPADLAEGVGDLGERAGTDGLQQLRKELPPVRAACCNRTRASGAVERAVGSGHGPHRSRGVDG